MTLLASGERCPLVRAPGAENHVIWRCGEKKQCPMHFLGEPFRDIWGKQWTWRRLKSAQKKTGKDRLMNFTMSFFKKPLLDLQTQQVWQSFPHFSRWNCVLEDWEDTSKWLLKIKVWDESVNHCESACQLLTIQVATIWQCWYNADTMLIQCWYNADTMLIQCWYNADIAHLYMIHLHDINMVYTLSIYTMNGHLWPDAMNVCFSFMVRFGHQEHSRTITPVQGWQRGFVISRAALGAKHAAGFVQNTMEHAEDLRGGPSWGGCRKRFGNVSMCCISFEYVPFNIGTVHVYYIYIYIYIHIEIEVGIDEK